jgi:hypothetical protein
MPPAGDTCAPRGSGERLIILCTTSGIGRARPYAPVAKVPGSTVSENFAAQVVGWSVCREAYLPLCCFQLYMQFGRTGVRLDLLGTGTLKMALSEV